MLFVHLGDRLAKTNGRYFGQPLYTGITGLLDRLSESVRQDRSSTVDYSINGNVFASPLVPTNRPCGV
jgi:hypothetical protein